MQIKQLDAIGPQPAQALLALALQRLAPAVVQALSFRAPVQPSLGRDDHLVAPLAEGLPDQPFAFARRAIVVCRIEKVDAQIETGHDRGSAVGVVHAQAGHAGNRPAAKRDGRYLDVGLS